MHMSDALLSPVVGLTMAAVGVAAVGVAVANVKKDELSDSKIPLMGVAGAMVFAAQMINFTIPATGSSGHIGGGILLAGLLGGVPAFLAITAVLVIQCLFFADGGLLALGCNVFNLGVIPCLLVYPLVFKPLVSRGINYKRLSAASILSVVIGLELGAFCVVLQTALSGRIQIPLGFFTVLMLSIHLVIGLVEGVVTAAVLSFIHKTRPEIVDSAHTGQRLKGVPIKSVIVALFALALITGGALALFASRNPDGLEWALDIAITQEHETGADAAPDTGVAAGGDIFDAAAGLQESTAFLPDYSFARDPDSAAGTSAAGVIGAVVTFVIAGAAGFVISMVKKRKRAIADG